MCPLMSSSAALTSPILSDLHLSARFVRVRVYVRFAERRLGLKAQVVLLCTPTIGWPQHRPDPHCSTVFQGAITRGFSCVEVGLLEYPKIFYLAGPRSLTSLVRRVSVLLYAITQHGAGIRHVNQSPQISNLQNKCWALWHHVLLPVPNPRCFRLPIVNSGAQVHRGVLRETGENVAVKVRSI